MRRYDTHQRLVLINYFKENIDKALSCADLIEAMKNENISPSAIYRNIALLEESGEIKRVIKGNERMRYYQYNDNEECKTHLHMQCIKCGKLEHIDLDFSNDFSNKLNKTNHFSVDKEKTIIYGVCKDCN